MHIIINQEDLVKAINIAQKAVSTSNMQILSGILLSARENKLTLMSTDFDISIDTSLACTVKEEGALVVSSNIFGDIIKKLPKRPIEISSYNDSVKIHSGDIEFNLSSLDTSEFPSMPVVESENHISLKESILVEAIDHTLFSASIDDTRPNLMGVLLDLRPGGVNFVSLDGYRLSRYSLAMEGEGMKIIIPSKSLQELRKLIGDEEELRISANDSHVLFEFKDTKFYSRILEGQFVDYDQLLGANLPYEAFINRDDFVAALERISLLASSDKAKLVKMTIGDGIMEFESNSEIGKGYEKISCDYEGAPLKIAFNNRYILDGARAIKSKTIKMGLDSPVSPAILRPVGDETDYTYLVLPVKLKSDD